MGFAEWEGVLCMENGRLQGLECCFCLWNDKVYSRQKSIFPKTVRLHYRITYFPIPFWIAEWRRRNGKHLHLSFLIRLYNLQTGNGRIMFFVEWVKWNLQWNSQLPDHHINDSYMMAQMVLGKYFDRPIAIICLQPINLERQQFFCVDLLIHALSHIPGSVP